MNTQKTIALTVFCVLLFSNHITHCMKSLVEIITSGPDWRSYDDYDEKIKILLENGADVDEMGTDGCCENKTSLTAAIVNKHGKTLELLLKHGADVNKRGFNSKETPLHLSLTDCPNIDLFVMTLLLERNARIDFSRNGDRYKETDIEIIEDRHSLQKDFAILFNILEKLESSSFKNISEITCNEFCSILKDCLKYKEDHMYSCGRKLFGRKRAYTEITISKDEIGYDTINFYKKIEPDRSESEIIKNIILQNMDRKKAYRKGMAGITKEYIYIRILVARMLFALTSKKAFQLLKTCLDVQLETEFLTTNLPDYPFLYQQDQTIHKQISLHLLKHFLHHGIIAWDNDMFSVLPSKKLRQNLYSDYMPTRMYESAILMKLKPDINFIFKKLKPRKHNKAHYF